MTFAEIEERTNYLHAAAAMPTPAEIADRVGEAMKPAALAARVTLETVKVAPLSERRRRLIRLGVFFRDADVEDFSSAGHRFVLNKLDSVSNYYQRQFNAGNPRYSPYPHIDVLELMKLEMRLLRDAEIFEDGHKFRHEANFGGV